MGQNYKVNSNQSSQRKKSSHYSIYSNKNNKKEINQKKIIRRYCIYWK